MGTINEDLAHAARADKTLTYVSESVQQLAAIASQYDSMVTMGVLDRETSQVAQEALEVAAQALTEASSRANKQ